MEINNQKIVDYCALYSSRPSSDCDAIDRFTYESVPMPYMLSGPLVGSFLGFLTSHLRPKRILEIGAFTGYSALCMAERLPVDSRLTTLELSVDWAEIAKRMWSASPHGQKIEILVGDAMKTLHLMKGPFELVFVDANKGGYVDYLKRSVELLSPNGVIVCDNALYDGEVLSPESASENGKALHRFNEYVKSRTDLESVLLPVRDGLHLIRRRA